MLERLSVQRFLLLDDIDLVFQEGLNILTGETGAGKSLLMDALDLCLGTRSEAHLVRPPHDFATLTAVFVAPPSALKGWLEAQGVICDDALVLKRVVFQQGKSRAFINDQSVTLAVLRHAGTMLVQIHGQFDSLLDADCALDLVDAYGGLDPEVRGVRQAFEAWMGAQADYDQEHALQTTHHAQLQAHTASWERVCALNPQPDEEAHLLAHREHLRRQITLLEGYQKAREALDMPSPCLRRLHEAQRVLEKRAYEAPEMRKILDFIQESIVSLTEAEFLLSQQDDDGRILAQLQAVDDRLAALRAGAKQLGCAAQELFALKERLAESFTERDPGLLEARRQALKHAADMYQDLSTALSHRRLFVAQGLAARVCGLFDALCLPHAQFSVHIEAQAAPSARGMDRAVLMLRTNLGFDAAPLDQVASGGERSRVMLALRTVLSEKAGTPTVVFDEIDTGMSGTVAHVVGRHMAYIGKTRQVLSITHSPQVAAQADHHIKLAKAHTEHAAFTQAHVLSPDGRSEEIARMLAGASITPEARLMACQLLNAKNA